MLKLLFLFFAALAVSHESNVGKALRSYNTGFMLYTRDNPLAGQAITALVSNMASIRITSNTDCAIIIDGAPTSEFMSSVVKDAFLTSGNVNVIVVDWAEAANGANPSAAVQSIASNVIELVRVLTVYSKISRSRLHIVGFGHGAHVAGAIGRAYTDVARITGLNPSAADNWGNNDNRLKKGDALYVEVIHTEITQTGIADPMGNVDFYPNSGSEQTGCNSDDDNNNNDNNDNIYNNDDVIQCSHDRAWELFAASLTDGKLIGHKCASPEAVIIGVCTGFTLEMGTNAGIKYGSGVFGLETEGVYPYRSLC